MEEKDYQRLFLRRMEREPYWRKILFACRDMQGEVITETGVKVKARRSGGVSIEYIRLNGSRLFSMVYQERQYIEELYRITEIAYQEHPNIARPKIEVRHNQELHDKVERYVQREEGLTND